MAQAQKREPQPDVDGGDNEKAVASTKLRKVIENYERLEEDKRAIADDQKQLLKDAKATGLDPAAIKDVVKARRDPAKTKARAEINRLYAEAIGLPDIFG